MHNLSKDAGEQGYRGVGVQGGRGDEEEFPQSQ